MFQNNLIFWGFVGPSVFQFVTEIFSKIKNDKDLLDKNKKIAKNNLKKKLKI